MKHLLSILLLFPFLCIAQSNQGVKIIFEDILGNHEAVLDVIENDGVFSVFTNDSPRDNDNMPNRIYAFDQDWEPMYWMEPLTYQEDSVEFNSFGYRFPIHINFTADSTRYFGHGWNFRRQNLTVENQFTAWYFDYNPKTGEVYHKGDFKTDSTFSRTLIDGYQEIKGQRYFHCQNAHHLTNETYDSTYFGIYTFDDEMNIQEEFVFDDFLMRDGFTSPLIHENGDFSAVYVDPFWNEPDPIDYYHEMYLVRYASDGTERWRNFYNRARIQVPPLITLLPAPHDGTYLLTVLEGDSFSDRDAPTVIHYDSLGNVLWTWDLTSSVFRHIVSTGMVAENGDLILAGEITSNTQFDRPGGGQVLPTLIRVSPEGERVWDRYYLFDEDDIFMQLIWAVREAKNGDLIVGGQGINPDLDHNAEDPGILFVVDEHGCFTPGCTGENGITELLTPTSETEVPEFVHDPKRVIISPNPTYGRFALSFERQEGSFPGASISIFDLSGRSVGTNLPFTYNEQPFDVALETGLYWVVVYDEAGKVLDRKKLIVQ